MRKASLRSTLDLQKKRLLFEDIIPSDSQIPIAMSFDKGYINDYRLGTAHLKGHLLLSLPLGQYPTKRSKSIIPEHDEFMKNWALEKGLLEEGSHLFSRFSVTPSAPAFYLAPSLQEGTKGLYIFLKFMTWNQCLDDFIDYSMTNSSSNNLSVESLHQLQICVGNILTGKYSSQKDLPKSITNISFFDSTCFALLEIFHELTELIPDYLKVSSYFLTSVLNWLDSISLFAGLMGKNWQSDMCYMTVRVENGHRALFEILCILRNLFLEDRIRKSLPYKIFYDAGEYIASLGNDLFSLEQELNEEEFSCNMVLRKCVLKKVGLQMAVDLCMDMVNDAVSDMDQAGGDLIQISNGDEGVQEFVMEYRKFVDGNLYLFAEMRKRYGSCKYTIKKVVYEDCLF